MVSVSKRRLMVTTAMLLIVATVAWLTIAISRSHSAPAKLPGLSPALWQVKLPGQQPVFLFGTIHVGQPDFYPLPEPIASAMAQAPCLIMEIDLNDQGSQQQLAQLTQQLGYYRGEQRLSQELAPELLEPTLSAARQAGLIPSVANRMKPWLLAVTLQVLDLTRFGYQPQLGVDHHLAAQALDHGQPIIALESAADQIRLLADDPQLGHELLKQTIQSLDSDDSKRLLEAWRSGDEGTLATLAREAADDPFGAALMAELLTKRNQLWVEQLERIWPQQQCSLAVGALHLVGPDSVVALLQAKGYDVERLPSR